MPSTIWSGKPRGPYPWNKRTNKQRVEDELLAKFRTEEERQANMAKEYFKNNYIREKYFRLTKKKQLYNEYRRRVYAKRIKEEYAKALHAALRTSWHQTDALDELTVQGAVEKVVTLKQRENREEWLETQRELDNFDSKREAELEPVESPKGKKGKGGKEVSAKKPPAGPLPKVPKSSANKMVAKGQKVPLTEVDPLQMLDLVAMAQKAGELVELIKAKKSKEAADRFERQQLQRKERLEKEAADIKTREEDAEKARLAHLWELEQGEKAIKLKEEQRIAEEEAKRQVECRQQMALALMEERRVEWEEVTNRDHEMFTMMREDYGDEVYQEWLLWEAEKQRKTEEKVAKRHRICAEIIRQIVTMMEIKNDYKDEFNSEMPATTWRGWSTLFVKGVILPCPINDALQPDPPMADPNLVYAKEAAWQYFDEQGEWQSLFEIGKNSELGRILGEINDIANSPPQTLELPNLTQFKLKLAVIGTPYAGKTTVADKLQVDFDIVRIDVQNVISSALALADVEEKSHKAQLAEEERIKEELEAQRIEEKKKKVEYELQQEALGVKELYVREKRKTETQTPESPPESPKSGKTAQKTKGKQKPEEKKVAEPSPVAREEPTAVDRKPTVSAPVITEALASESVPEPESEVVVDPLAYLTPKGRHGMEIKLAQLEGLKPPAHALAGLVVLTILSLQEYADAFAPQPPPKKGAKGAAAAKKGAPPPKGGKAGSKAAGTGKKGAPGAVEVKQWGFILDGFPTTAEEAKALEWRLTGIDLDYMDNHKAKASKIAPPPVNTDKLISGLDGFFQLQALEHKEALKRAMGKVVDPKTGAVYHLDYYPPPMKEKGLAQRLKPLEELEVARAKIFAGMESWIPLTEYLERFSNVFPVMQIDQDNKYIVDTVLPDEVAHRFLGSWEKTQAAKAAAQAAFEAETASSQALANAEQACKVANEIAGQLWNAKLAEVETEKSLDALGSIPLGKKLVKEKSTVTVAKRFEETCKAVKEAEEAAEAARAFAMQAEQMAHEAQERISDTDIEFALHVKEEAEAAADAAKQAATRAEASHQKAVAAFEAATAALSPKPEEEKAASPRSKKEKESGKKEKEKESAKKEKDKEATKKEKDGAPTAEEKKNAKGTKDAGKVLKSTVDAEVDTIPDPKVVIPAPAELAPPEPPKAPALDKDFAVTLHSHWVSIEANYFKGLESVFYELHRERATTRNMVVETITDFVSLLRTKDERQAVFDDFQEKYNRMEMPQRRDKKVKPKLRQEVAKLEMTLNTLCEHRSKQCWEISEKILVRLLEERATSLIDLFAGLVQAELDRHVHTCSLLNEFFNKSLNSALLDSFTCDLSQVTTEPNEIFPVPGWLISLSSPLPKLYKVIMTAMSLAFNMLDVITGKASQKGDSKKRKDKKDGKQKSQLDGQKNPEKSSKKDKNKKGSPEKSREKGEADAPLQPLMETVDNLPPPIAAGIPPAAGREHQILLHRLQRIGKVAYDYFLELQPIIDGAYKRIHEWGKFRLNAEAEVIKEVVDLATEAVEENIPLWYRVYLDGDTFRVDDTQLQLECPVKELTNLNLWHCKVMEALLLDFKKLCPQGNFVTGAAAKATTDQAVASVHTSFKDDLKESLLPRLPASKSKPRGPFQAWQSVSDTMFKELSDDELKGNRYVDWRAFLIALVDAHYSYIISNATREDILNARTAFIGLATQSKPPEAVGLLALEDFLSIPLWFDASNPVPEGEYDLGLSVKIFVYNVLEEGGVGVQWQKLLLYLCRDTDPQEALQKAFSVIGGTISDDIHLKPEEVLQILYPGGIDAAWNAEVVPFILEDLQNLLYYVAREKYEKAERAKESDLGSSDESGTNGLEDEIVDSSETSDSEHGTVTDFLTFAYDEFPELVQAETVNDFLQSLSDFARLIDTEVETPPLEPYVCDIHAVPAGICREASDPDEFAIPQTFTVEDIVRTSAVKRLFDTLYGTYGTETLQLLEKTPIEDDSVEKTEETEGDRIGKKQNKDGKKKKKSNEEKGDEGKKRKNKK